MTVNYQGIIMDNEHENTVLLHNLATKILNKRLEVQQDNSLLVAVSGIDGSGKGYITEKLIAEVNNQGVFAIAINIDPWLTLPEIRFNPENPVEQAKNGFKCF
ncbi:hypothetical protein F7734_33055 [Scytonema sp. UIC 10036]|uniref:hypothetical protein n=1 Tax=Scytonema sp. UIC 10036 TaxID=2304196 RepID=UPI0012DA7BB0|nr:hypothetical protein [Scytonema sp. UIC 10036]MUG96912.1 hypothetical protein [Scytonema sp. UIC 10036]